MGLVPYSLSFSVPGKDSAGSQPSAHQEDSSHQKSNYQKPGWHLDLGTLNLQNCKT